jgi:ribosomal protein S18 acetylase RimI-like enzyme
MDAKIEPHPEKIGYAAFSQINDLIFLNEPVSEAEYQEFIFADFWIIYEQDALIGYSVMTNSGEKAHIRRIGIHPDFRSKGFAAKLMDRMLNRANDLDVNIVTLSVQQDNRAAIHLYEKYGFRVTGESVQFSVPIIPMRVEPYYIISIDEYQVNEKYYPPIQQILDWADGHQPPHKFVLVFLRQDIPVGFVRFSPDYPGCQPFELFSDQDVEDIRILVSLLDEYALPGKRTIKITTGNSRAIELFRSASTKENYSLYEMVKILKNA